MSFIVLINQVWLLHLEYESEKRDYSTTLAFRLKKFPVVSNLLSLDTMKVVPGNVKSHPHI